jgi:hypothetical protein
MKVEKKRESFCIVGYLAISKKILCNLTNLGHFFHEKSFQYVEIVLFKSKFDERFVMKS